MGEARALMKEKRIRHLPVTDSENRIIGMLSKSDLTDVMKFEDLPVELFSTRPVEWVLPESPLWCVANIMVEKKISAVLVCNKDSEAVGILTSSDLLFQFSKILKEKEKTGFGGWTQLNTLSTVGEFFKELADIGI